MHSTSDRIQIRLWFVDKTQECLDYNYLLKITKKTKAN